MVHPNEDLLRSAYEAFAKGDRDGTLRGIFDPNIKWHVPGQNPISGDRVGVDDVFAFFGEIDRRSGGSFDLEIHDLIANDTHAVVLVTTSAERDGKKLNDHNVHVWHVEGGKAKEFWGHSGDQYAVDEFWS